MNSGRNEVSPCIGVPPLINECRERHLAPMLFVASLLVAAAGVLFWFNPSEHNFYPLCLFHQTTGLLCPGCGALRALHHLLHGHLIQALHYNLVLVMSLPFLMFYCGFYFLRKLRNQPSHFYVKPNCLWLGLFVLLLFGTLRNFPFARGLWLAP
jgi:hypothetical protein